MKKIINNKKIFATAIVLLLIVTTVLGVLNVKTPFAYLPISIVMGVLCGMIMKDGYLLTTIYGLILLLVTKNSGLQFHFKTTFYCLIASIVFAIISEKVKIKLFSEKEKLNKKTNKNIVKTDCKKNKLLQVLTFAFPAVLLCGSEAYYLTSNPNFYHLILLPSIILGLILIYLFWLLLLGFTKSTFKSNLVIGIFLFLFFVINQIKVYFTNEPISIPDLLMVTQAGDLISIVKTTIFETIKVLIYPILFYLVMVISIMIVSFKNDYKIKHSLFRIAFIFLSICLLTVLFFPNEKVNNKIQHIFLKSTGTGNEQLSLTNYYGTYRVTTGLYGKYLNIIDYSKDLLTEEDFDKLITVKNSENTQKIFHKPNIIVMFTESFWDVTKQNNITFNTDPLKEYHELSKKGILLQTLSPVNGGGSANTEFEFLTGGSINYLKQGQMAYMKYYNSKESVNNPSIIKELENNGYTTELYNASSSALYNCKKVYNRMGIDKTTHLMDTMKSYPKDKMLGDAIIDKFNNKPKDEKAFMMTISMESHVPYNYSNYSHYDFKITSNQDKKIKDLMYAYVESLYQAQLNLKRVYDYIQTLDEDTIIIFFGDHHPYLKAGETMITTLMDYYYTNDDILNNYRYYNTETLILSNYDIDYDDITSMGMDMVMPVVMNKMDINISDYYKWLYSTRTTMPMSNYWITMDGNETLYRTDNIPTELQELYNTKEKVQRHLFK